MERRTVGVCFCFISALLFSTRYITAAIFGSNVSSWSKELFNAMLEYTGGELFILSIVSLIIGSVYLISSEIKG